MGLNLVVSDNEIVVSVSVCVWEGGDGGVVRQLGVTLSLTITL